MIGKTISHYKILEKLGEGGMGVVYKAEDSKLKRTVALKFLTPLALGSEEEKARFVHEAQVAAVLDHPNICTVYEIDEAEGQTFIAMAHIAGQSLKEKTKSCPIKLDEALDIAIQVAEGLQEAHEKGIVHRDIKSANIMVTPKGQAKIMDFGLAKLAGRTKITKTGMTMSTVAYMSPEQTYGQQVDHRTDIWALGVVLYEMGTGQLPFRGDYEQAVVYSVLHEEPEPMTSLRTGVPVEMERIVNKALAKSPDERYQHVDEMLVDLKMLRKELQSVTSAAKSVVTPPGPSVGKRPLPFLEREKEPTEVKRPAVVARENELEKLDRFLDMALSGQGRVVFVTGEAGDGKTALIQEFAGRSQDEHPDLIVASGNCNAHTGIGDPYLPFREVMGLLTGDVETKCAAGVITREHATRLWNFLPLSAQALVDVGTDLINTFVSGETLVTQAATFASGVPDWFARLKKLVERKMALPADVTLQQS
ncbi:MAG: protein kinase, partial [bacterium]